MSALYKKNYFIFLSLLVLIILLRFQFSFLNLSVGEHDWTYLSLGKSLYNGNLPYVEAYGHRGPLVYIIYAIPFLFKNYIISLKLLCILSIWLTAIICFKTSEKFFGKNAAIVSSFSFSLVSSSELFFLTSDVEIFLLPFIALFIHFLYNKKKKKKRHHIIIAALAISAATLIRSYLGIIAVFGCFILLQSKQSKILNLITYIVSGLLPLIIFLGFYINIENGFQLLWNSLYLTTFKISLPPIVTSQTFNLIFLIS